MEAELKYFQRSANSCVVVRSIVPKYFAESLPFPGIGVAKNIPRDQQIDRSIAADYEICFSFFDFSSREKERDKIDRETVFIVKTRDDKR